MTSHKFFRGAFFNFEAIRILGTCRYGGAEVAECLEAISHIRDNNADSWFRAWSDQAAGAESIAQEAEENGLRDAARSAYLRASNYTRASAYMMTGESAGGPQDPRVVPILHRAVELFQKALESFEGDVHKLQIPYRHFRTPGEPVDLLLPAYLYLPPSSRRLRTEKTPILVNPIGADSIQEEIFYMFPAAGPELGYAVLTYEGPGQGLTLHEGSISMIPDWEVVNSAVLDYLSCYSEENKELSLDLSRIAVAGASLGAYFALRSAVDKRVKACVAIDPLYSLWDFATEQVAPSFFKLWSNGWIPDSVVNSIMNLGTRFSFQMRWEILTSARFLGSSSPVELLRMMRKFSFHESESSQNGSSGKIRLSDSLLEEVTCPTFVTGAANSLYFDLESHTMRILNELKYEKRLWIGSKPGEGGLQAKMGAIGICTQRSFQFLDEHLQIERCECAGIF